MDLADLRALAPSHSEMLDALRWCVRVDGRPTFMEHDGQPLLEAPGLSESDS